MASSEPRDELPGAVRAIGGVVRLLCDVRLAVLALGFATLATDAAAAGPAFVIGLLAIPFSYFPARSWDRRGELFSRSGILLAADLVATVIVIFALRGSDLVLIYGAATVALLGVMVGVRLALYMSLPIGLAQLAAWSTSGGVAWPVAVVALIGLLAMSWAGSTLGRALRTQAHTARELREAQAQQAAVVERVRIARDLHDTVAGDLAGAILLSRTLLRRLEVEGAGAGSVQVAEQLDLAVRAAHADTRVALGELRRAGTSADRMLTAICSRWTERTGIPVEAHVDPDLEALSSDLTDDLRAIVLELLENVRKHAGATSVSVLVRGSQDAVTIQVSDDGCGFEGPPATSDEGGVHLGLVGITERLEVHGGRLEVRSAPGAGATVDIRIPLHAEVTAS